MAISLSALGVVAVEEAGVTGPFTRPQINFIQGGATSVVVADDVGNDRVNVTISSTDTGMTQLSSSGQRLSWTQNSAWAGSVVPSNFSTMICFVGSQISGNARAWAGGVHACFAQGCGFVASNFSTATMTINGNLFTQSGVIMQASGGNCPSLTPTNNGSGGTWNGNATAEVGATGVVAHATFGWSA